MSKSNRKKIEIDLSSINILSLEYNGDILISAKLEGKNK